MTDSSSVSDPVLAEALDHLHGIVNVSDGATHPLDREKVIGLLRALDREGIDINPQEVYSYLVNEKNWQADKAENIRQTASGIQRGKQFDTDPANYSSDFLDRLREQAEER